MVKLTNTAAACDRSGVKCVVYGIAKSGKTSLIATAPAPLILSSERGLLPLRSLSLPVITIENQKDLDEAFAWLAQSSEARNYKTVCVDSITDLADAILMYEIKNNPRKTDKWLPFNRLAESMTEKLRDTRNSVGKNWYLICQEEIIMTAEGTRQVVPSLPGKALLQGLPYLFDIIARLVKHTDPVTGHETRMLNCRGDNSSLGGDRSGRLDQWEPPNLTALFEKALS